MIHSLSRFMKDETGATAIEYGLIASLISVAIATILLSVGTSLKDTFSSIQSSLTTSGGTGS